MCFYAYSNIKGCKMRVLLPMRPAAQLLFAEFR
jgi:hypothetical protein